MGQRTKQSDEREEDKERSGVYGIREGDGLRVGKTRNFSGRYTQAYRDKTEFFIDVDSDREDFEEVLDQTEMDTMQEARDNGEKLVNRRGNRGRRTN